MRYGLGLLTILVTLTAAASAQAAPRHTAAYWNDRALEASNRAPECAAQLIPLAPTTDAPAPPEVVARYGILRTPPTETVAPLQAHDTGQLALQAARTRTVDGIQVTVTVMLNWRPYVRSAACDAVERRALDRLLRGEPSAAVRDSARARHARFLHSEAKLRTVAGRTLLYLSAPGLSPIGNTGALELSRLRGLYANAVYSSAGHTFFGLIPDGVARIRYRAKGRPDVEVPVVDNIVVVRLPGDRTLGQQVWLRADGSVVRTIGRLG